MRQDTTMQAIQSAALQYATVLDELDQQGLNRLLLQTDAEILMYAMRLVEHLDWGQDQLKPQLMTYIQEAA